MSSDEPKAKKPSRFIEAAKKAYDEQLREYLETKGKELVHKTDGLEMTALHWATRSGHLSTVQLLLAEGASPDARDIMGETSLHKAAYVGNVAICRALVEGGASRDIENNEGRMPFDLTEAMAVRAVVAPVQRTDEPDRGIDREDSDSD